MPSCKITKPLLLLFLWVNIAFSQNFPGKNYTAANELPNNAVRSLLVDSNNILWIGTENGVVKKENDIFTYFFEEDGLALNSCWAIAEDRNKKLWFGSYGEGVSIYDGFKFRVVSEEDGLVHNEITTLFPHGKHMYVGTSDGVSIIDINTFNVLPLDTPPVDELFRITGFFEHEKQIYVATYNSGLYKIQTKNNRTNLLKVNDHTFIYSVFVDKDSIYSSNKEFFTKSSVAEYVSEKDREFNEKLGFSILWDHVKTRDDRIFAAGWGIYDANGGIYEIVNDELISKASEFNVLSNKVISLAYDARFEKLYIGTKDAGLYEINLNPQIKINSIHGKNILGFAETENTSAVLLNDALILKNSGNELSITLSRLKKWQEEYVLNTKIPLPKHRDHFYELDYTTKAEDISFNDLKVFQNIYWLNTNVGIFAINDSGELRRYLPVHSEEINFTEAGNLLETNPYGGVRLYNDLDAFKYTYFTPEDPKTPTMVVNSLQQGNKTYFLSVFSGLYVWENNGFKSYLDTGIWKEKKLKHITPLENNIAVSNEFGDVFIVNDEAEFKVLKKIPRAKIQGNSISFLKQYRGNLIIGTEKGLTLYKNDRFIFLDEEQGLKQPLLSADVDHHKLSIGSENGFYSIDLEVVSNSEALVDEVKLKEVFINNDKTPSEEFINKEELELPHNENTLLLKLSTNAHPYPHKLTYQYRLNKDDRWSLPSPKPEIFLPFLPAKNYDVAVKVLDKSTGLSHTQSLLHLAILPPFWKTWWFGLAVTSLIFILVYSVYRLQIRQTRNFEVQKGLIQKRFEETKMEALLAQMNPHFIFNAMNSIQNYIMDRDIDNASSFLNDFAKLIRLNLDHCTKPRILLIEEIEYLQSYIRVENTRFNNRIKVIFDVDPLVDVYDVEIPTMLLQTFVENVFVHAFPPGITDPTLKISFKRLSENLLQCKIEDNGIGYATNRANKLHKSKGITLVKERLSLLGYDVEKAVQVNCQRDKGTTVTLRLQV
ncbi:sensor histidine kinase [Salinimicrobium sediminilitoris]|uniref:sensor histidine kinase n=1 Tax=Salinimicrobium sediminilitoris TaxID=2876715 RepID=UPI001E4EB8A6|nr:histidine kinase [Salinimicrobium sediminilitoris]MCC8360660.1 histidine kinase [Salinimicrobium sediminilitoris]